MHSTKAITVYFAVPNKQWKYCVSVKSLRSILTCVANSNWGEDALLARDLQLYTDKGTFEGMSMVTV